MALRRPLLALATVLVATLLGPTGPAPATGAQRAADTNPLATPVWGVYDGVADGIYPAWELADGLTRDLLGKIALRPRTRWFGHWIPEKDITDFVRRHVADSQDGNPNALVHMAVFRLWPLREDALHVPLTMADRAAYRRWVDGAARGIGSARVALVLEPDLAVALKGWRPRVRLRLARYAAEVFGRLPNTHVYIDASDSDWLPVADAVRMLLRAGVQHARGFALGATHYASLPSQLRYGKEVVEGLARAGVPNRHFVADTADNGRPFTMKQFREKWPNAEFDNAPTCRSLAERRCVTLGVPPTSDVTSPRWGLGDQARAIAARHVDAYLWFGRPWLFMQAAPFDITRALAIARTTPY